MSHSKEFLFAYYGWFAAAFFACSLVLLVVDVIKPEIFYAFIGGIASFAYFIQKQKLEETSLFRQLFDRFNERYDKMNEQLSQISLGDTSVQLLPTEVKVLIDYFNLCAEEYLYYKRGYIPRDVWCSWCNGMQWYYANPQIRALWDKELEAESFYGFAMPCKSVRVDACAP